MKELIIISKEEGHISYKVTGTDKDDPKSYHPYYMIEYINENNLDIDYNDDDVSGILATKLAQAGISTIIVEGKIMSIYLPENMTKNQLDYYKGMHKLLMKFSIYYMYIKDGNIVYCDEDSIEKNTYIKEFYKYLKEKMRELEDGYRRSI